MLPVHDASQTEWESQNPIRLGPINFSTAGYDNSPAAQLVRQRYRELHTSNQFYKKLSIGTQSSETHTRVLRNWHVSVTGTRHELYHISIGRGYFALEAAQQRAVLALTIAQTQMIRDPSWPMHLSNNTTWWLVTRTPLEIWVRNPCYPYPLVTPLIISGCALGAVVGRAKRLRVVSSLLGVAGLYAGAAYLAGIAASRQVCYQQDLRAAMLLNNKQLLIETYRDWDRPGDWWQPSDRARIARLDPGATQ